MAWEQRGQQQFYYRTYKLNGRVVRSYLGRGGRAKRAAAEDALRRQSRAKQQSERKYYEALDAQLRALAKVTKTFVKASFYGAGFHQHKREWRWRRGNNTYEEGQDFMQNGVLTLELETATYGNLETLVQHAQHGDTTTLPAIRMLLDQVPELWEDSRVLAKQIERSWIATISGKDLISREILEREVQALRTQLHGPNPSPLETLLIERICNCWLAIQHAELIASKRLTSHTMALSHTEENRLDKTHRRFLTAIRELAKVRKLLTPTQKFQVNIGAQQIVA